MASEPPASVQDENHPTTNINNSTKDETSKPNNDKNKPGLEEEVLVVQSLPASRSSPSVASPSVTGKKAESTSTQAPKTPDNSSNNENKDKDENDDDNNDDKGNSHSKSPVQKDQENKMADTDGSSSPANSPDSPDLIVVGQQVAQHRPPSNSMAQPPISQENMAPVNRVTQTKRRNTSKGNNQGGSGTQYQQNPPPAMQMYQNTLNFSPMSQYIHRFRNKPTAKKSNIPPLVESSSKKSTHSKSVASQPSLDDNDNDNDNDNVTPSSAGVPPPSVTTTNRNNGINQSSRSQNKAAGPPRRARQTEQSFGKLKPNARTQDLYQVDESRSPSLEIYDIEATEPSNYPEPYPGQRPPATSKPNKNFPKNAPSSRNQFVNGDQDSPAHDPQPATAIHQYHPHTNQPPSPPSPPTYQYQYRFRVQPPSSEQQQQQQYSQLPQKRKRYPIDHPPPPPSSSPFLPARAQAPPPPPPPQRQRQRPFPTKQIHEKSPLYTGPPYRITRHGTQNAVTVTSFVEAENQRFLVLGEGETPYTLTIENVGKGKSFIIESDGSNPVRVIPLTKRLN